MATEEHARIAAAVGERYRVLRRLAVGGMAAVYLALDTKHDRQVALKVLEIGGERTEASDRFDAEIRTIAGLQHPHILPLHDSGSREGLAWFVMPFVAEGTLRDRLKLQGPLPIAEALRIGREVAEALACAHRQGIVHRDVKPENIMIDSGQAVVTDFGIAVLHGGDEVDRLTTDGRSPGTPEYMSPEQAQGDGRADPRSDVYSLGCVIYEMLAGDPPFSGSSRRAVLARKLVDPVPSLSSVREGLPAAVQRTVEKALARVPADRYASAAELAEALGVLESMVRTAESDGDGMLWGIESGSLGRLTLRTLGIGVGAAALLPLVGMLSTRALDARLRLPSMFAPSSTEHFAVGVRAVIPVALYGLAAVAVGLAIRLLLRLADSDQSATGVVRRHLPLPEWLRKRPWSVDTVAELAMLAMIAVSILVLFPFLDIYAALIRPGVDLLACEQRPHHLRFQIAMPALIVGCGAARWGVLAWARRRDRRNTTARFFRWLSAAWLVVLLIVTTLPWRTLFDAYYDRALIDGVPAYLIREVEQGVLAYVPDTRSTRTFDRAAHDIESLEILGYAFEGPEMFRSSQEKCDAVWYQTP